MKVAKYTLDQIDAIKDVDTERIDCEPEILIEKMRDPRFVETLKRLKLIRVLDPSNSSKVFTATKLMQPITAPIANDNDVDFGDYSVKPHYHNQLTKQRHVIKNIKLYARYTVKSDHGIVYSLFVDRKDSKFDDLDNQKVLSTKSNKSPSFSLDKIRDKAQAQNIKIIKEFSNETLKRVNCGAKESKSHVCYGDLTFRHVRDDSWELHNISNIVLIDSLVKKAEEQSLPVTNHSMTFLKSSLRNDVVIQNYEYISDTFGIIGRVAEIAHANLNPDHEWMNQNRDQWKTGCDFKSIMGKSIDVKGVLKSSNRLAIEPKDLQNMADAYYLYYVEDKSNSYSVEYMGFCTKENVLRALPAGINSKSVPPNGKFWTIDRQYLSM